MFRLLHIVLLCVALVLFPLRRTMGGNPRLDTPPKLVIELVVGTLGSEVVDLHWESLSSGGLARLYSRGVVCQDARYNHLVCNAANGLATLSTGTDASQHGIIDDHWYSHLTNKEEKFAEDDFFPLVGIRRSATWGKSPRKLLVSSLSDSWRQTYPSARIYSVAYNATEAMLLGGRSANAALWYDAESGTWISSSYYCDSLPVWVQHFNARGLAQQYDQAVWNPTLTSGKMVVAQVPLHRNRQEKLDTALRQELKIPALGHARLCYTPSGNSLLKDLIVAAVEHEGVGRGRVPDLLSVYFTPLERIAELYGVESHFYRDALLRFDRELASLLEYLDVTVGRKDYLVVLTSSFANTQSPWLLAQWQIPAGYFSPDKAVYLLSSYLSALYGLKDVVLGYSAQTIYLNEPLLEKAHLPLLQVEQTAAKFLQEMNGIAIVYPMHSLLWAGAGDMRLRRALGGFHAKRSGHLLIDLMPGWVIQSLRSPKARNSSYSYNEKVPLVFYGWKLQPRKIVDPVFVRDIPATLARILYLREPNGSIGNPIPGVGDWNDVRP